MAESAWQKSSYCAQGEACLSVAVTSGRAIQLTESSDPSHSILTTDPATWAGFLRSLKESDHHG
ncbi:DUF397 domain-containing protein [Streptomyces sp. NPDC056987]|uniref:DUF397 domain-containing protein n=1 Tax=Streptomyces sp. NPDC056987 TaxID=3345988 RepID=UPI003644A3F9